MSGRLPLLLGVLAAQLLLIAVVLLGGDDGRDAAQLLAIEFWSSMISTGSQTSTFSQPLPGSQSSIVQASPSSQSTGVPTQLPPAQASPLVHAEPSSHASLFVVNPQPVAGSQVSSVQPTPSLTSGGVPAWHAPWSSQVSAPLQYSPSSQSVSD